VLYHDNCPDGFGAAWAAWLALGDDAEYRGVSYGQAPPVPEEVRERLVYVLDFSYPRQVLLDLKSEAGNLLVLDHHATAQESLAGLPFCEFDLNRSGATMAWDHFVQGIRHRHRGLTRKFSEYLTDRDLWRFELPMSREVSAAVWSYPRDFVVWTDLSNRIGSLKDEGRHILRFKEQLVEQMVAHAEMRDIGGYLVPVANATVAYSEVGEALCKKFPDAPFAAYYMDRPGGVRQWGARSRGFDVSKVAKELGGGGHPTAAGWIEKLR
jgi:oligoribonuclease NrnB/cAMP/cGMP phosphodiesterase (DHH superfamily)